MEIAHRIQFHQDSDELVPDGWVAVAEVSRMLASEPGVHLVVEGHASAEGDDDHNWDLSQRRGLRVYESLISMGVEPGRISYRGLGEWVQEIAGEDEQHLAPNRRVLFDVLFESSVIDEMAPKVLPAVEDEVFDKDWEELP